MSSASSPSRPAMYDSADDRHVAALLREAKYHSEHVRQGLPDHVPYLPAEREHREEW